MSAQRHIRMTARERLLAAANELFYEEGVHTVGIDLVIEKAGVAKATLYSNFGSKDGLIRAYLEERHRNWEQRMKNKIAQCETPRDRLLAVFEVLGETFHQPGHDKGCPFMNASAEAPSHGTIQEISDTFRSSVFQFLIDLAQEAEVTTPEHLARQLLLLYDGATVAARMDRNTDITTAMEMAKQLIDEAMKTHVQKGAGKAQAVRGRRQKM